RLGTVHGRSPIQFKSTVPFTRPPAAPAQRQDNPVLIGRAGESGDEALVDLAGIGDPDGVLEGLDRLAGLASLDAVGWSRIIAAAGEERLDLLDQRLAIGLGDASGAVAFVPSAGRRADAVRLGERRLGLPGLDN